jgi:hypothetical protein
MKIMHDKIKYYITSNIGAKARFLPKYATHGVMQIPKAIYLDIQENIMTALWVNLVVSIRMS